MYGSCFLFNRLSTGRSVGGNTDSPGHSNECFYRLLGSYLDQKRDDVSTNNEPSIGRPFHTDVIKMMHNVLS